MVAFGQLVWGTLALRPYVFIFLSVYLWLATWHWGLGRTLLYLVAGYGVAWLSEFSSIYMVIDHLGTSFFLVVRLLFFLLCWHQQKLLFIKIFKRERIT
jgi:hypothetical protein